VAPDAGFACMNTGQKMKKSAAIAVNAWTKWMS